jgi:hypothetical protein
MQKNIPVASPGTWLCLLGSTLALIGFFLPYYSAPPGSSYQSASLWYVLLLPIRQEVAGTDLLVKVIPGLLLLSLLSGVIVAGWLLFFRPVRWASMSFYRTLTGMALVCYLIVALGFLLWLWVGEEIAGGPFTFLDVLGVVGIGVWFIPAGLLLALIGGVLLERREGKAGS